LLLSTADIKRKAIKNILKTIKIKGKTMQFIGALRHILNRTVKQSSWSIWALLAYATCLYTFNAYATANEYKTDIQSNSPVSKNAVTDNAPTSLKTTLLSDSHPHWYKVPHENTVTFVTEYGEVVIALSPALAPNHVERFQALVKAGFYNQQHFYRVVDGFVAQGGSNDMHDKDAFSQALLSELTAEFTQPISKHATVVESRDMFAPETGFLDGFAVGMDRKSNEMWGLHCPGTVAFARNSEKDTAATEFYIVIGQAPRHLDRNMSVIGRVVQGMDVLQKLPRGDSKYGGVIQQVTKNSAIRRSIVHNDQYPSYFIQLPEHEEYASRIETGKTLNNPFFHDKKYTPRPVDVCYYQTKTTLTP
jgi:peptidylprolyl isomerase